MERINVLDSNLDKEAMEMVLALSWLEKEVSENPVENWKYKEKTYPDWSKEKWYMLNGKKEWKWVETLSNWTVKEITYKNWKKNGAYSEKWKGVYERSWWYKDDFKTWIWVEKKNNWSKIEWRYDDFWCQDWKWIKTDSNGNVKEWEYKNWMLVSGTKIEFVF